MLKIRPNGSTFKVFILTTLAVLGCSIPALAWGRLGHRVISRLAEQRLTDKAKAGVAALLLPGESLADASLWADYGLRHCDKCCITWTPNSQ
jgi:hypothetical protein